MTSTQTSTVRGVSVRRLSAALLAVVAAVGLAAAAHAGALAYDDFEHYADGADIPTSEPPNGELGLEQYRTGRATLTGRSTTNLFGQRAAEFADDDLTLDFGSYNGYIRYAASQSIGGKPFWASMSVRADSAPAGGLRFGVGDNVNGIPEVGLQWAQGSKWLASTGAETTSTDPVATPQANTTYDVLFAVERADPAQTAATYDAWVNGVQVFDDVAISLSYTNPTDAFTGSHVGAALHETATFYLDNLALYSADPRVPTPQPGTESLLVGGLTAESRIDDGVKGGQNVVWASLNSQISAYAAADGSVVQGPLMTYQGSLTNVPLDLATPGGGPEEVAYINTQSTTVYLRTRASVTGQTGNLYNAGISNYPPVVTGGRRLESGTEESVMFVPRTAGNPAYHGFGCYDMSATAVFKWNYFTTFANTLDVVDLAYSSEADHLFWITAGNLYIGDVSADTWSLAASDALITADSVINAGMWGGEAVALLSYSDGTWDMFGTDGSVVDSGSFGHGVPLDVALGTDQLFYLVDEGAAGVNLYTYLLPEPASLTLLALGGVAMLGRRRTRRA